MGDRAQAVALLVAALGLAAGCSGKSAGGADARADLGVGSPDATEDRAAATGDTGRNAGSDGAADAGPPGVDAPTVDARIDRAPPDAGLPCTSPMVRCGAACVDPAHDPMHCGATAGCGAGGTDGGSAGAVCASQRVCSPLVFQTQSYATGTSPRSLAVADLDGDGKLDVAAGNYRSGDVSVLLGNGDGTFQGARAFAAGASTRGTRAVVAGDVDRDGKLDLASVGFMSNEASVMLGNGDGTFQTARTFPVGMGPAGAALGDVNGDGKPDLAVANVTSRAVSLLLGNGDGTFQAATSLPFPNGDNHEVALVDLNGDGKLDLAVDEWNDMTVMLGNGDGTFRSAGSFLVGSSDSMAFADIDGDGRIDAVNAALLGASISLGNGDGTFQVRVHLGLGETSTSVALADVDGDGKLDLVASVIFRVSISLGNGDGTFKPPQFVGTGNTLEDLAVADVNGDGRLDLVVANADANRVDVLLGGTAAPACR